MEVRVVLDIFNAPTTSGQWDRLAGPLFALEQALHDFSTPTEASALASAPTPSASAEVSHG